ncbi:phosphoribosyltransferase [Nocardia sp. NBC_00511]|uniref:phosphoribosyltransferase n=1 Tax=Nocardia sp. NBC_00511 TaxID=2903591 RepID=UPI0030E5D38A
MTYPDRGAAGRALGAMLEHLRAANPLVLGLPRGGVPVAAAVWELIGGDLDVLLVRKLGVPWQPELAMGAIGEDGVRVLNRDVVRHTGVTVHQLAEVEILERTELERRRRVLRTQPPIALQDRTVLIVDDGMATGATVAAGCKIARRHEPRRIVVAVPVSSVEALHRIRTLLADEVVCPLVPRELSGVGGAYQDFHQLDDAEVVAILDAARQQE